MPTQAGGTFGSSGSTRFPRGFEETTLRISLPTMSLSLCLALAACSGGDDTGDTGTDPNTGDCVEENGACVLEGTIDADMTLTADKAWLLRSAVSVGDDSSDVTLTIEAGTTIYGESASGGFLVVTRGAKIVAQGTAAAPIRFTSDQPVGSRARGDWGGVAINGRAPINACTTGSPSPCEAEGEGGTGVYGGDDPADDSGSLDYVVIEFGGTEISPDNEINGLGLQGVGSGTHIDHVQIHRNLDDGVEFFGGTVDVKHLLITAPADDGIDWDLGYSGRVQYAIVQQGTDAGNMGTECDNNESDHLAAPVSNPTLSNVTFIGSPGIAEDNYAMLFRRGASPKMYNVAADGFSSGCLAIRDQETFDAFTAGVATLQRVVMACDNPFEDSVDETETGTEDDVFAAGAGNALVADLGLTNPFDQGAPSFVPAAGSPLLDAGQSPSDAWFDATTYVGAIGTDDWTAGWTTFAAN